MGVSWASVPSKYVRGLVALVHRFTYSLIMHFVDKARSLAPIAWYTTGMVAGWASCGRL